MEKTAGNCGGCHANINTIAVLAVNVRTSVLVDDVSFLQEGDGKNLLVLCFATFFLMVIRVEELVCIRGGQVGNGWRAVRRLGRGRGVCRGRSGGLRYVQEGRDLKF